MKTVRHRGPGRRGLRSPRRRGFRAAAAAAALAVLFSAVSALAPGGSDPAEAQTRACGTAVPDPADNQKLVDDCLVLLTEVHAPLFEPRVRRIAIDRLGNSETRGRYLTAVNWSSSVDISKWDGVTVGRADGHRRVTKLKLPANGTPILFGYIPPALGKLDALKHIDFTGNRLGLSIPASVGRLKLRTLFLGGNRLSAYSMNTLLPTFEHPQEMRRIRLVPNGWESGSEPDNLPAERYDRKHPFDTQVTEKGKTFTKRSCVPAVWVDADTDNDNLTKWSRRSLMGKGPYMKMERGESFDEDKLQFLPCPAL